MGNGLLHQAPQGTFCLAWSSCILYMVSPLTKMKWRLWAQMGILLCMLGGMSKGHSGAGGVPAARGHPHPHRWGPRPGQEPAAAGARHRLPHAADSGGDGAMPLLLPALSSHTMSNTQLRELSVGVRRWGKLRSWQREQRTLLNAAAFVCPCKYWHSDAFPEISKCRRLAADTCSC